MAEETAQADISISTSVKGEKIEGASAEPSSSVKVKEIEGASAEPCSSVKGESSRSVKGNEGASGEPFSSVKVKEIQGASTDPWLTKVKKLFSDKKWQVSKEVCIYRVPKCISINKPSDYYPFDISFGPYHHENDAHLSQMDQYKLEAMKRMSENPMINVTGLIGTVQNMENEIRKCYAEPIEPDGEKLAWMLTMDACFILEFLRNLHVKRCQDPDIFSLIFQSRNIYNTMSTMISKDIIKLENQIPFCILIALVKIVLVSDEKELQTDEMEFETDERITTFLAQLLNNLELFQGYPFIPSLSVADNEKLLKRRIKNNPCHLLDLYRMVVIDLLKYSNVHLTFVLEASYSDGHELDATIERLYSGEFQARRANDRRSGWWKNVRLRGWIQQHCHIPLFSISANGSSPTPRAQSIQESRSTPCAQSLQVAGIKFLPGKLRFEKKRFGSSTLFLPPIFVDGYTELGLRNLMAYEECQRCSWFPQETLISQYIYLFDDLIDSEKDVAILKKADVIVSVAVSDNDIADMFNHIQPGITFDPINEIEAVMKGVRQHYRSQWKVLVSQFKEEYFSKPWYVVPLVMGMLILSLTITQTVSSK